MSRHGTTQQPSRVVFGLTPEEAHLQSKETGPTELVQHQTTDARLNRSLATDRLEQPLLVGRQYAACPMHPVEDHAADAHEIEFVVSRLAHDTLRSKRVSQGAPISLAASALTSAKASSNRSASTWVSGGVPGATQGLEMTPSR